ncbi:hypothetical protein PFICI_07344 [Pestalotiopsis fici W106-1]|uniref:Uncharacterized protein n=1 Tax=Pestalotiopsis fici (strain W106-1 / CGMCC3.15140) TaxID=1229662 RepID=W3X166_PESFW|nr:uncharacterized protein PFICI_07344 [Pestalotiopsis fici W106-1]ETS79815.1 hypothetical protein PFICI_07344 [Pestalotiopsis fici W106-1]
MPNFSTGFYGPLSNEDDDLAIHDLVEQTQDLTVTEDHHHLQVEEFVDGCNDDLCHDHTAEASNYYDDNDSDDSDIITIHDLVLPGDIRARQNSSGLACK